MANDTLGERIRTAYERAGLNRNQFAQKIGTVYHNVIRWEDGANVGAEYLAKIIEATECDANWLLLGRDGEPSADESETQRLGTQLVEEVIADAGDDMSPEHAAELRSFRFGGLRPTKDMLRGMWREMIARDAQKSRERPPVTPPKRRPGRKKIS